MSVSQPRRFQSNGGIGPLSLVVLLLLLALPGYALSRLAVSVDWRILAGAPAAVSLVTFLVYRSDKRRAGLGEWRVPESTLHFCELMGGWPGAFLAQRQFRHKVAKLSYQSAFWFIVGIHQLVAFDSLAGWRFSKEAWRFIRTHFS